MPSIYVQITCSDGTKSRKIITGLDSDQKAILGFLEANNLLTEKLYDKVAQEKDSSHLHYCAWYLEDLSKINCINQKTFNYMWNVRNDSFRWLVLSRFLKLLRDKHIAIDDQLLDKILLHPRFCDLDVLSRVLSEAELLTVDNFNRVLLYINPFDIGDISEILSKLNDTQPLNQTHLETILSHKFPALINVLFRHLKRADIPLGTYFIPIINNPDKKFIEHVGSQVQELAKSEILNKDTFDLVLAKYFGETGDGKDIDAVKCLIQHDLFTKPNLHFIKYGHFLVFGNHKEGRYFRWEARSEALVSLKEQTYILLKGVIPRSQYEEVDEPLPKALNKLFKMTTDYLCQSPAQGKNHALCYALFKLQGALFVAYSQFETDKNASCLKQSFSTHIAAAREYLERAYSFTEKIQKLFNQLLNAIQYVLGVSKEKPWGTFFAQGHRVGLMTDLIHAPKMQELSEGQVNPPDVQRP